MYRETYSEISLGDQCQARHREHDALKAVISLLQKGEKAGAKSPELTEAIDTMENLWMVFLDDLSRSENALPEDLRARLISIGLWIVQKATAVRIEGNADVHGLIEINSLIRDGLR